MVFVYTVRSLLPQYVEDLFFFFMPFSLPGFGFTLLDSVTKVPIWFFRYGEKNLFCGVGCEKWAHDLLLCIILFFLDESAM